MGRFFTIIYVVVALSLIVAEGTRVNSIEGGPSPRLARQTTLPRALQLYFNRKSDAKLTSQVEKRSARRRRWFPSKINRPG
ncbi:unnamed protein product, partial [Mesorhabditis spiculigera]